MLGLNWGLGEWGTEEREVVVGEGKRLCGFPVAGGAGDGKG